MRALNAPRPARAKPIHIRAPVDLLRDIDKEAARRRQTRTRLIWDAVRRELNAPRQTP